MAKSNINQYDVYSIPTRMNDFTVIVMMNQTVKSSHFNIFKRHTKTYAIILPVNHNPSPDSIPITIKLDDGKETIMYTDTQTILTVSTELLTNKIGTADANSIKQYEHEVKQYENSK